MAKAGRGSEQVMIRLPDGMRDRIKAMAEKRGRSMNSEIVRALEMAFPEPMSLADRVEDLLYLLTGMRKIRGYDGVIDPITEEILETLEGVAAGRVPDLDDETIEKVRLHLFAWRRKREIREGKKAYARELRYLEGKEDEP